MSKIKETIKKVNSHVVKMKFNIELCHTHMMILLSTVKMQNETITKKKCSADHQINVVASKTYWFSRNYFITKLRYQVQKVLI